MENCVIVDCGNPIKNKKRRLCNSHYLAFLRHGDPLGAKYRRYESPEERFAAHTVRQGECLIWTGGGNSYGYGTISVDRKTVQVHRYAWERVNGPIPKGMVLDHKDHCSTRCCDPEHLRLATRQQNLWNLNGANKNNKGTGELNIYQHQGRYRVDIQDKFYGSFNTVEEAIPVRDKIRKELYGEFAGKG